MSTNTPTHILMCSPDHFQVEYVINPWMKPGTVDSALAHEQWTALKDALTSRGVTVDVIAQAPGVPDMVFAADQGLVHDGAIMLSHFCYKERQGETSIYRPWFESAGLRVVEAPHACFEGGECLEYRGSYFLGVGFRATHHVVPTVADFLDADVIPLELVDAQFYHLDTALFILDEETAFFYPPAFSPQAQEILADQIPNLLAFSADEATGFCANCVKVGTDVLLASGNESFEEQLRELGYTPLPLDISEFVKAGGGIHCLTLTLE